MELLARYKEPGDFLKAHTELRQKLSERPSVSRLDDEATPEQIAEYRQALGVQDVSDDAEASAYVEALGIKMPEGVSEVDAELVSDFAKFAYENGNDPRTVNKAVNWFFEQQEASKQASNLHANELAETWQSELRQELGREYEPTVAVAKGFLNREIPDEGEQAALMNAMLPDGGRLGDNPAFIKMMAAAAMNSGLGDSIEANSMESGGKSLRDQQSEIEALRTSDPGKYNDPQTQARLDKIIDLRLSRGEIDEMGNERKRS